MTRKLNILHYYAEVGTYMNQWQRFHFIDELQRAGHTITIYNPLSYRSIDEANERLPKFIAELEVKIDLFINPAPSTLIYKHTLQAISSLGVPSLLICFDNLHAPFIHKEIAPFFDLVWLTSSETEYLFKIWGCTTIFLPYAANPYIFKPEWGKEIDSIGFIGTLYDDRVHRINQLTNSSVPCTVYSNMVSKQAKTGAGKQLNFVEMISLILKLSQFKLGRKVAYARILDKLKPDSNKLILNEFLSILASVPFDEINSIYSNHALSLNITELRNTFNLRHPIHKLHLRTFEISMCGGLQIAPYVEELASYFKDGEEIILCKSDEDFISKSKFYLKPENESLRLKMKSNARKRSEAEHTWNNRFSAIFKELFGN
ncbi:MAG: glycosyltransferase family protein [Bacteroidales bacterium]